MPSLLTDPERGDERFVCRELDLGSPFSSSLSILTGNWAHGAVDVGHDLADMSSARRDVCTEPAGGGQNDNGGVCSLGCYC